METEIDQNLTESEEVTEETPLNPKEIWAKLTGEKTQKLSAPIPATPVEEVDEESESKPPVTEQNPPPKIDPEPSDPLVNDPKLVKRFRDSQQFISTLKDENKQLANSIDQLKAQVAQLQQSKPAPTSTTSTSADAESIFADILDSLSPTVREEVETFPELFQGIDALIRHRLGSANKAIEGDLQEVRKAKHERYVQQKLNERHAIANRELGITNSAHLDLDDPDFAQWVLSSASRKNAVLDFENPLGFVDLVRSYLYDYPDQAQRPVKEVVPEVVQDNPRRKAASRTMPSRPPARNIEPRRIQSLEDKAAFWGKLTSASA